MNIYLTKSKTKSNKGMERRCKIYVFRNFRTPKSSMLKQLEIKIVGDHSRFQKLQIDK